MGEHKRATCLQAAAGFHLAQKEGRSALLTSIWPCHQLSALGFTKSGQYVTPGHICAASPRSALQLLLLLVLHAVLCLSQGPDLQARCKYTTFPADSMSHGVCGRMPSSAPSTRPHAAECSAQQATSLTCTWHMPHTAEWSTQQGMPLTCALHTAARRRSGVHNRGSGE